MIATICETDAGTVIAVDEVLAGEVGWSTKVVPIAEWNAEGGPDEGKKLYEGSHLYVLDYRH